MNNRDYLDHNSAIEKKRYEEIRKHSKYCKCGHTVVIANVDRVICSWCGNYVFKDEKTEFRYKMMENIRKGGK